MTRITASLCVVVCLLVTSDWLVSMTSCMLVDDSNHDTPMTGGDTQESLSEALRRAMILRHSPSRLDASKLDSSMALPLASSATAKRSLFNHYITFPEHISLDSSRYGGWFDPLMALPLSSSLTAKRSLADPYILLPEHINKVGKRTDMVGPYIVLPNLWEIGRK